MKRLDIILIIFYIIAAVAVGIWSLSPDTGQNQVVIRHQNELYGTYPLPSAEEQIVVIDEDGHYNKIRIAGDSVAIIEANCPDQLCVKDGEKSKPGDILVCLPNQVLVEIEGVESGEIDFISH
jgi:hypothetical protein